MPPTITAGDKVEVALDRAAAIAGLSRDELAIRCQDRVGGRMDRAEFLVAAAEEAETTVGILLEESSIAEEVRKLTRQVREVRVEATAFR